jgi:hypothetical protein
MIDDMTVLPNTMLCYLKQVHCLSQYFRKSPAQLTPEDIREYLLYLARIAGVGSAPGSRASTGSFALIWSLTRRVVEVERSDVTWRLPCKHSRPHHKWSDAHADHQEQERRRDPV